MTVYRTVIPRKAAFFSYPLFSFSYPASPKYSCSRIIATIPALKRKTAPDLSLDGFIILDEGLSDFDKGRTLNAPAPSLPLFRTLSDLISEKVFKSHCAGNYSSL